MSSQTQTRDLPTVAAGILRKIRNLEAEVSRKRADILVFEEKIEQNRNILIFLMRINTAVFEARMNGKTTVEMKVSHDHHYDGSAILSADESDTIIVALTDAGYHNAKFTNYEEFMVVNKRDLNSRDAECDAVLTFDMC